MALEGFGISFMPGADNGEDNEQGPEPFQSAVKLLNLRLPSVVGARSPINAALLHGAGLQGQPNAQFLRALQMLGIQLPAAANMQFGGSLVQRSQIPGPRVTPAKEGFADDGTQQFGSDSPAAAQRAMPRQDFGREHFEDVGRRPERF